MSSILKSPYVRKLAIITMGSMVSYSSEFHIYLEIMLTFGMKLFCPFLMKIEVTLNYVFLVLLIAFFSISSWILFPAEIYSASLSIDLNRAAAAASPVNRLLLLKHAVRWFSFQILQLPILLCGQLTDTCRQNMNNPWLAIIKYTWWVLSKFGKWILDMEENHLCIHLLTKL